MSSIIEWFTDPLQFDFMRRAFVTVVVIGLVTGFLGTYVIVKGIAFMGDAIAHSVFPGLVIAFLLHRSLFVGAAFFGLLTAFGVGALTQTRRVREDAAIGVLFAGSFALGIVLISSQKSYAGDLTSFLFGEVLAVSTSDIVLAITVGAAIVLIALTLHRQLIAVAFDREMARAMGLPVFWLDMLLYVLLALAIVISLRAVGNILVVAMLVTPAATARLLTDRLVPMMGVGALLGAGGGVIGLYLSYHADLAAGGLIVLVVTAFFALAWLFAPRHGIVSRRFRRA